MPPVQRVVSTPDLITAPDKFPDSLVSWNNPSRVGTLGHYVTPDAPAGMSDGFATTSPRGELPAPAHPWWWPRPPIVQRRIPTSTVAPDVALISSDNAVTTPPPAVPVYPRTGQSFVSAAGAEPRPPRLTLPAVQRHAAESDTSPQSGSDSDLPAGESPPEAPPQSVLGVPTELLPGSRRLGLGAPLQRIPDSNGASSANGATVQRRIAPMESAPLVSDSLPIASAGVAAPPSVAVDTPLQPEPSQTLLSALSATEPPTETPLPTATEPRAGPSTGGATVQRQVEVGGEPMDVAPLVSDSPPMTSVGAPSTPSTAVDPVNLPNGPATDPIWSPPARMIGVPTAAEPPAIQRQGAAAQVTTESFPTSVAPLVSGSPPISPETKPPTLTDPAGIRPLTTPSAGSRSPGPSPSPRIAQRTTNDTNQSGPPPLRLPLTGPTPTPPTAAAELPPGTEPATDNTTVQRQTETSTTPTTMAPLISDTPSIASVTPAPATTSPMETAAGSPPTRSSVTKTHPPGESPTSAAQASHVLQRAVDTPRTHQPEKSPPAGPTPTPPTAAAELPPGTEPATDNATVQRQTEVGVEPMDVAPLVSDSPPMTSVGVPSTPSSAVEAVELPNGPATDPVWSPPARVIGVPTAAEPPAIQRQGAAAQVTAESFPTSVAPLVSGSPPISPVTKPPTLADPTEILPLTTPPAGSRSTEPSPSPRIAQRTTNDTNQSGRTPLRLPMTSPTPTPPTTAAELPPGTKPATDNTTVQRQTETSTTPTTMAPLISAPATRPSIEPMVDALPPPRSGALELPLAKPAAQVPPRGIQRAVDTSLPSAPPPSSLSDRDEVTNDNAAPAVAGLVGDRSIESIVTGYGATSDSSGAPAATSSAEQTRRAAVQRHAIVGAEGPRPGALVLSRSSSGVSQPTPPTQTGQFVQFASADPIAAESHPPQLSSTVVVQRADEQGEQAGSPAAMGPSAATSPPAQPVGSTSPTEVDTLVSRLYDPLVRRIKAELQLDRERAGRSLDLWH
jgi:hypothetical protein